MRVKFHANIMVEHNRQQCCSFNMDVPFLPRQNDRVWFEVNGTSRGWMVDFVVLYFGGGKMPMVWLDSKRDPSSGKYDVEFFGELRKIYHDATQE